MARRLSIFPLRGTILLPGQTLGLHIFEDRYRALVREALASERLLGIIQPQTHGDNPTLFKVGGMGKITNVEAFDDGRFNIILEGQSRFKVKREHDVTTPFRQIEPEFLPEDEDAVLSHAERGGFETEARRYARALEVEVDWGAVGSMDDASLINGVAQIAPFDPPSKQALLEAENINERCEQLVQLMQFHLSGPDNGFDIGDDNMFQ